MRRSALRAHLDATRQTSSRSTAIVSLFLAPARTSEARASCHAVLRRKLGATSSDGSCLLPPRPPRSSRSGVQRRPQLHCIGSAAPSYAPCITRGCLFFLHSALERDQGRPAGCSSRRPGEARFRRCESVSRPLTRDLASLCSGSLQRKASCWTFVPSTVLSRATRCSSLSRLGEHFLTEAHPLASHSTSGFLGDRPGSCRSGRQRRSAVQKAVMSRRLLSPSNHFPLDPHFSSSSSHDLDIRPPSPPCRHRSKRDARPDPSSSGAKHRRRLRWCAMPHPLLPDRRVEADLWLGFISLEGSVPEDPGRARPGRDASGVEGQAGRGRRRWPPTRALRMPYCDHGLEGLVRPIASRSTTDIDADLLTLPSCPALLSPVYGDLDPQSANICSASYNCHPDTQDILSAPNGTIGVRGSSPLLPSAVALRSSFLFVDICRGR